MGVAFLVSFITGFCKFTFLLADVRPYGSCASALLMSDIHDWAGLARGFFDASYLFYNRARIITMTRKIPTGTKIIALMRSLKNIFTTAQKK